MYTPYQNRIHDLASIRLSQPQRVKSQNDTGVTPRVSVAQSVTIELITHSCQTANGACCPGMQPNSFFFQVPLRMVRAPVSTYALTNKHIKLTRLSFRQSAQSRPTDTSVRGSACLFRRCAQGSGTCIQSILRTAWSLSSSLYEGIGAETRL